MSDIGLILRGSHGKSAGAAGLTARLRHVLIPQGESGVARQAAFAAFAIRLLGAVITYAMQIFLARAIGASEYGLYVWAWSIILIIGHLAGLGLSLSAARLIADLRNNEDENGVRGFIRGSRLVGLASATLIAALLINAIDIVARVSDPAMATLVIMLVCLPLFTLGEIQDAIARCHDAPLIGLIPPYILRPLLVLAGIGAALAFGFAANARTVAVTVVIATFAACIAQALLLHRRIRQDLPAGPAPLAVPVWLHASLPLLVSEGSRIFLQSSDVVILAFIGTPQDVGAYYAVSKTLVLGAFVAFAVGAATSHRLAAAHVSGDRQRLADLVRQGTALMFWATLASVIVMLLLGRSFLSLFGADFPAYYPLMFVLALGFLVRAAIGPAERLLAAMGDEKACARIYVATLLAGLALQIALASSLGVQGLALAVALTLVLETILLWITVRRRHGLTLGVWQRASSLQP